MFKSKGTFILFALLVIALVLPTTVLARKAVFKAKLSSGAELHEVVEANPRGGVVIGRLPSGFDFTVNVSRGLSSSVTGVHLHGPATEAENGPVLITLCGQPAPAALANCPFDASTGSMTFDGEITSDLLAQWDVSSQTLTEYMDAGLVYVNVHTVLNPAGETRGQVSRVQ